MKMNPASGCCSYIPVTLCITLLLWHQNGARATTLDVVTSSANLIEQACKQTPHKELCISTLKSDPNSETSDITGLGFIALNIASIYAKNTTTQIKKLQGNPNYDAFTNQCLNDCYDHYLDAIDQVNDSSAALSVKVFKDIDNWVNAAIADADACEEGFKDQPGHPMVLTQVNENFRQLCNNALVIANLVSAKP